MAGLLLLLATAAVLGTAKGSPFDPHVPPSGKPFVEGWYTRVTDHANGVAFAVVLAGYSPPDEPRQFNETWVAMLLCNNAQGGATRSAQHFPDGFHVTVDGHAVDSDPVTKAPSNFTAVATGTATLSVNDDKSEINATIGNWTLSLHLEDRVPWDPSHPNSAGPEGWAPDKLLPTHYFIHTLASKAAYRLTDGHAVHTGGGFAHQEANWGSTFPSAWVWGQAIGENGTVQLIFTGGEFAIGKITSKQFVIGIRTPKANVNFQSIDLDTIKSQRDACNGTLSIEAHSPLGENHLTLVLQAEPKSFSSRLYVPSLDGFHNNPGCSESFSAVASIKLKHKDTYEEFSIPLAALEFGGEYVCPQQQ